MIAFAISYGLFTLTTLWAGAGAHPSELSQRTFVALIIYAVIVAALVKLSRQPLIQKPFKIFHNAREYQIAAAILALHLAYFGVLYALAPTYLYTQGFALSSIGAAVGVAFLLTLGLSDFAYRKYFAPVWGNASAAFLEALTWGLATQSFVGFVWIFVSGWMSSKFLKPESIWGSVAIRLILGLAWITLASR